jgi:hypothetical protein
MYDRTDERGVPISGGIPPLVVVAAVIGVVIILTIISLVFRNSGFGHAWPASTSVSVPLS